MVLDYYKLQEHPFGVTPDSRYLFLSATHREALASVLYGVDSGCAIMALISAPGLGKTTLLFHVLNQLREKARTVFLFETVCTPIDLVRSLLICLEVRDTKGSLVQLQLRLKEALLEQSGLGKRVVVVIDEAQNLGDSVLELVRMLSNFETAREKLIQIILSGQPQLAEKMASPKLERLRQRVSMFTHLKPFSREETELYINHRLRTAGYDPDSRLFTRDALALIAENSGGIPRTINNLCFNSLALGCASRLKPIGIDTVREVIADLDLERFRKKDPLAVQPAQGAAKSIPAFLSAHTVPSRFALWVPKVAMALVALLIAGGLLFAARRWSGAAVDAVTVASPPARAETAAAATPVIPTRVVVPPASPARQQAAPVANLENTISVTPGKTLVGLCVQSFGRCTPEILHEILKLNPELSNLDHIEIGQKIRIPAPAVVAEMLANASPVETARHE